MITLASIPQGNKPGGTHVLESPTAFPDVPLREFHLLTDMPLDELQDPATQIAAAIRCETGIGTGAYETNDMAAMTYTGGVYTTRDGSPQGQVGFSMTAPNSNLVKLQGRKIQLRVTLAGTTNTGLVALYDVI